ncbi:MAG: flagellar filament capping protein FliD [Lachnospiraceae bacterium]|nr:flagellar filament capping protein FliD [Lachnospiraceae bacterium]
MAIRMTGMISGLDTESLIQSLVEAQKLKNKKTTDKKTKLEWTQDKWKDLNTKLYSLYTKELNKLTLQSSYMTKKTTVSNDTKLQVKAGATAPLGSQTVTIENLATSGYLTGSELGKTTSGGAVTQSTKLSELGITGSTTLNLTVGDKSTYIEVNGDATVSSFVSSLQSAGINANLDTKNNRIFLSSKQSGEDNDFSLTASSAAGTDVLKKLGLATGTISVADELTYQTWASNAKYNADGTIDRTATIEAIKANDATKDAIDNEVATRVATYTTKVESLTKTNEELTKTNETLNKAISESNDKISDIKGTNSYKQVFAAGTYSEDDLEAAKTGLESEIESLKAAKEAGTITEDDYNTQVEIKETQKSQITEVIDLQKKVTDNTQKIQDNEDSITANTTEIDGYNAKLASDNAGVIAEVEDALVAKADYAAKVIADKSLVTGSAKKVDGENAKFTLNGVAFSSATNETTVNGVTLTMTGETALGEELSFTITNDTQAVYDGIKNFVNKYNEILKEMNELYYADSARGYDPLSDDEREAMTDDQIEKWETKIKDSLLRRDSTLGSITNAMKNALLTSVEVDGKRYSLSSFGVGTSSAYLERGLLHIQGDEDDSMYASYTNKLMNALEEDPDTVMQVFTGVAKNMYKALQDKMKKTSLSSALTFYNDIYMKNQITALNKQISKEEESLTDLEDKYYKQFAAMESAMAKMQSQQNSLSAYL